MWILRGHKTCKYIHYRHLAVADSPLCEEESSFHYEHRVFFLRSQLPARLFGILVGAERVSAQAVVLDILCGAQKNSTTEPSDRNLTSDVYTPIRVDKNLTEAYLMRTSVEKESLCWGLLLTLAFMDLIMHQNPQSLRAINSRKSWWCSGIARVCRRIRSSCVLCLEKACRIYCKWNVIMSMTRVNINPKSVEICGLV